MQCRTHPSRVSCSRIVLSAIALLTASLAISGAALANEFGFVDMERVIKESKLGRAAESRLEARFGERTQPFVAEERAIRALQQTLERDKPLMSKAQVDKQETEIRERIAAFEERFASIQREMMQAQQEEARAILDPAQVSVNAVAKQRKLVAVMESSQTNLLYLSPEADITDAVITHLDAAN